MNRLEQFWSIQNCFQSSISKQLVKGAADRYFRETIKRDDNRKFVGSILFERDKLIRFGEWQQIAYERFDAIEQKLAKDLRLKELYIQFMTECGELGHMSEVRPSDLDDDKPHLYLPYHTVIKEQGTATKLRVVGSAKSSTKLSLNETHYTGTPVQDELFAIILKFRQHFVVISTYIAKMYRQLLKRQQSALCNVYYGEPIEMYRLRFST